MLFLQLLHTKKSSQNIYANELFCKFIAIIPLPLFAKTKTKVKEVKKWNLAVKIAEATLEEAVLDVYTSKW